MLPGTSVLLCRGKPAKQNLCLAKEGKLPLHPCFHSSGLTSPDRDGEGLRSTIFTTSQQGKMPYSISRGWRGHSTGQTQPQHIPLLCARLSSCCSCRGCVPPFRSTQGCRDMPAGELLHAPGTLPSTTHTGGGSKWDTWSRVPHVGPAKTSLSRIRGGWGGGTPLSSRPAREQGAPLHTTAQGLHPRISSSCNGLHTTAWARGWADSAVPPRTARKPRLLAAPGAKMILLASILLAKSKNGCMDTVL